jgi:hypothetical protein
MHAALRLNELHNANSRCALARPAPPLSCKDADFDEAHVRNCGPFEEKCASSLVLLRSSCC